MSSLSTGIVKWFDEVKGFGLIVCEDGVEIIAYYTSINETGLKKLQSGQRVTFAIGESTKGPQAISISISRKH